MTKRVVVGVTVVAVLAAAALAHSQQRTFDAKALKEAGEGRAVYLTHCAGCHGMDARGGLTRTSQSATPDLTLIALRDGGFDARHVGLHVDGRAMAAQGEMPCWGKFFAYRATGSVPNDGYARTRVYALTRYLDFVQQPEGTATVER